LLVTHVEKGKRPVRGGEGGASSRENTLGIKPLWGLEGKSPTTGRRAKLEGGGGRKEDVRKVIKATVVTYAMTAGGLHNSEAKGENGKDGGTRTVRTTKPTSSVRLLLE